MAALKSAARYRWVILGVAFLAQMGNALATQAVGPLAPIFQPEMGLTKVEVGLFSSAIFVGWWCVLLVGGSLTDRLGIRTVASLGQMWTGLGMLGMAAAGSFLHALAVMFTAGLGSGTTLPAVTKAITDWFPRGFRGTAMGLKQAAVPVAGMVTATTLPPLALTLGWRWAIAAVGGLVIVIGIVVAILYREAPRSARAVGGRGSIRAGLKEAIRSRALWAVSAVALLYVVVQSGLTTYLALFLNDVVLVPAFPDERARIVAAGGYLALCQMGGAFGRVFWGLVSDRVFRGRRMVVLALSGILAAAMSLVVAQLGPGYPLGPLAAVLLVYGVAAIGWNGLYHVAMTEAVARKYAGTGIGLSMTMSQLGTAGGAPLFGFVVDLSGSYQAGWLLVAGIAAVGALVAIVSVRGE